MKKRILSVLITLVMLVGLVTVMGSSASAADDAHTCSYDTYGICECGKHNGSFDNWTRMSEWIAADYAYTDNVAHVYLDDDIALNRSIPVGSSNIYGEIDYSKTLYLHLNDKLLTNADDNYATIITSYGNLTIYDNAKTTRYGQWNDTKYEVFDTAPTTGEYSLLVGGAIYGRTDNKTSSGGGIMIGAGSLTMYGGTVAGNKASMAGGIYVGRDATATLDGVTITDNKTTAWDGGGIYSYGILTMSDCTVTKNVAVGQEGGGGIFNNVDGSLTMSGCTITGNKADRNGSAIYNEGALEISDSTITGNIACQNNGTFYGGGIYFESGTIELSGKVNITGNKKGTGDNATDINVYISIYQGKEQVITIENALTDDSQIGVTTYYTPDSDRSIKITSGGAAYAGNFVSDKSGCYVAAYGTDLQLKKAPTYYIYRNNYGSAEGGSFKVDVSSTYEKGTVTITPVPDEGYVVDTIKVYKTDDESVTVPVADNKFTMPAYSVTVSVTFKVAPVSYGLWVGGVEVTSDNKDNIVVPGATGSATYDPDSNTLTLDNFSYEGDAGVINWSSTVIYTENDLKIVLIGENSLINTNDTASRTCGINGKESVEIIGDGTASLYVESAIGIEAAGVLSINGVDLEVKAWGEWDALIGEELDIVDSKVKVTTTHVLYGEGMYGNTITIKGSDVTVTSNYKAVTGGKVSIIDSTVTLSSEQYAIVADDDIEIKNSTFNASIPDNFNYLELLVIMTDGNLLIEKSTANITTGETSYSSYGIEADTITFDNSFVTIDSASGACVAENGITVSGENNVYNGDSQVTIPDASTYSAASVKIAPVYYFTLVYGIDGMENGEVAFEMGQTLTLSTPTRDGYVFGGWYNDAECTEAFVFGTSITGDITLYAKWIKAYDLWVGGVQVTSANKDNIVVPGATSSATYNPETSTLTLNNFSYTGEGYEYNPSWYCAAIYFNPADENAELTIELVGTNTVIIDNSECTSFAIYIANGNLIIEGNGSLTVTGDTGIYAWGNISISDENTSVIATGNYGIQTNGGDIDIDGGKVEANGGYNGIVAYGNISISSGEVRATATYEYGTGIYAEGNIDIDGGKVEANGGYGGIYADGNIDIDGDKVDATGSLDYGIYAAGPLTINGGIVTVKGSEAGIYVENNITIDSGTVKATATDEYGIGIVADTIIVTNATVEAIGTGESGYGMTFYDDPTFNGKLVIYEGDDAGTAVRTDDPTYKSKYVKIAVPYCDVTVNYGIDGIDNKVITIVEGDTVSLDNPLFDGYVFMGWFTDDTYQTPFDPTAPITESITVYAKFTAAVAKIEKTGTNGLVDTYTITYTDGTTTTFTVTNGDKGDKGDQGIQGIQGIQGVPGADGHTPIITIQNGYWYIDGENTNQSAQGIKGDTGNGISDISKTGTNGLVDTYTITYTNGTTTTFTVTNGDKGDKGDQGIQGIQGIQGVPGADGHTPIITIQNGYWYIDGENTNQSAQGIKGDTGNGISDISKTGTSGLVDTYTITYTDGTTTTFTVTNGEKGDKGDTGEQGPQGDKGDQGIQGIQGADGVGIAKIEKTSSDGNVDTYTITLTNGTTYTFTVTNGTNGTDGKDGVDGKDGTNGTNGVDGKDGTNGTDGQTPYIGENGNWWIGDTDTGVKAAGDDGKDGTIIIATAVGGTALLSNIALIVWEIIKKKKYYF